MLHQNRNGRISDGIDEKKKQKDTPSKNYQDLGLSLMLLTLLPWLIRLFDLRLEIPPCFEKTSYDPLKNFENEDRLAGVRSVHKSKK